ncbi:Uncharacterised protein [Vibrio cholerae]|nr:Uncharacterised protein [Vibrio cholerae]CSC86369.1 Uncharacterised protein [Vibrio cholerae]
MREAVQTAPNSTLRALLKPDGIVVIEHDKPSGFDGFIGFRFLARILLGVALLLGKAKRFYWAQAAFWLAASADHRAHIHHGLVVFINIHFGRVHFCIMPKLVFDTFLPRPTFNGKAAR